MDIKEITKAILHIRPNAQFTVRGDDLDGVEWLDKKQTKPTDEEILAAIPLLEAKEIADLETKAAEKAALLAKLGISESEAALLLS